MAILLAKDAWKLPISRKLGITLMTAAGFTLMFFIISSIVWMNRYDPQTIMDELKDKGKPHDFDAAAAYVRFKTIVSIVGNTLVLGFFSGLVWWAMNKKRMGFAFGIFWLIIFGANAISLPFYSVQIDAFTIISAILNAILAITMLVWIVGLMQFRSRMREEIARKKH